MADVPIAPAKFSSFYRYSMPSVVTNRPDSFYEQLNKLQVYMLPTQYSQGSVLK
jgi:hypothetical protein